VQTTTVNLSHAHIPKPNKNINEISLRTIPKPIIHDQKLSCKIYFILKALL